METKRCTKCGEVKALDGPQRLRAQCKTCVAERQRQYRSKNADLIAERQRRHYLKNADQIAEYQRQYKSENADQIAERNRRSTAAVVPGYVALLLNIPTLQVTPELAARMRVLIQTERNLKKARKLCQTLSSTV